MRDNLTYTASIYAILADTGIPRPVIQFNTRTEAALRFLLRQITGLQLWPDDGFVAEHGQLNQRLKPVVSLLLPSHSANWVVDGIDLLISNRLGTGIGKGVFGGWNHDVCVGLLLKNLSLQGAGVWESLYGSLANLL